MKKQDIESLVSENGAHCISIIMPTEKIAQYKNYEAIRKAIGKAREIISEKNFSDKNRNILLERLDRMQKASFEPFSHGLGIFVSENRMEKVIFPFQVTPRIIVSDTFESRDLLYLQQFLKPYYVLSLTRYAVRLFKGMMDTLEEVVNSSFPFKSEEDYEYEKPSIASSDSQGLKSYEKDKSIMATIRIKAMFREADKRLAMILTNNETRLILAGTQKIIGTYTEQTPFKKQIVGHVKGSFNKKNFTFLKSESWEIFVKSEKAEAEKLVQRLLEHGHLVKGLEQAWKATNEGKGIMLAVDKDYHCQGYLMPNINTLFQSKPEKPAEEIPDAVEKLIKVAHDKHMPVYFLDHDELKDLGPIALQTR